MIGLHQSLLYSNRTIIKRALKNNLKIFQENKKFFAWNSDKTWIYKHTKLNIPRHDNDMDTETWNKNPAHCNFFPFFCSYCVKSDSSKIPRKVWRKNSWLAAANVCNSQAQTSSINSRQYKKVGTYLRASFQKHDGRCHPPSRSDWIGTLLFCRIRVSVAGLSVKREKK